MLKANYHTHTTLCDGLDTPEDIIVHAINIGFEQIGFSGHFDPGISMDVDGYIKEIKKLRNKYVSNIDILLGVEADNMVKKSVPDSIEFVIGSTHYLDIKSEKPLAIDLTKEQFVTISEQFFGSDYYNMSRAYYDLVATTYDNLKCTFVGHFDLITRFNDELGVIDEDSAKYYMPALEAMEYLCDQGVPFEINCGAYNRGRKKEVYPSSKFLRELRRMNGRLFISSDAHKKELLNGGFEYAIKQAMVCGFTYVNILKHDKNGKVVICEIPIDSIVDL